ncbi:kinase-like domain-containing protein [Earliella scabrosa]|nr:kinase-like domain-containing protein [Earliella scabrosa]
MPATEGYGWAYFDSGQRVGKDDRYTIARKLGWGMHSSTWLARDNLQSRFVAIKALTGYMTSLYDKNVVWEADAMRLLSRQPLSPHCSSLLDEFVLDGRGSAGKHLCLVLPLYGGDVKALVKSWESPLPLPLAKRIALHLLRGLAHAHRRGVVHTDLKHDNIFFETILADADIEAYMQPFTSPPTGSFTRRYPQPSNLHPNVSITTPPLRAPEVYLGAPWDTPADIWSYGCLVYELATSDALFRYREQPKFGLTEVENMFFQMQLLTGTDFTPEQLRTSPRAGEFFASDCQLKKKPSLHELSLEHWIMSRPAGVPPDAAAALASFMRKCMRLDPADRATAEELLGDPWFEGIKRYPVTSPMHQALFMQRPWSNK